MGVDYENLVMMDLEKISFPVLDVSLRMKVIPIKICVKHAIKVLSVFKNMV